MDMHTNTTGGEQDRPSPKHDIETSRRTARNIRARLAYDSRPVRTTEFAGWIGNSYQTAARKLRGEQPFTIDDLQRVSSKLGITVTELTRQNVFPEDWENEL